MPLWSVAEWRARIGSSWCALGRPFKTKSSLCHGEGQTEKTLTWNHVTVMMSLMTTLIVGFHSIIIQERHQSK